MDRAEYREKIQEIKNLNQQKRYAEAAEIILQINWRKVKSASTLTHAGVILGRAGKFAEGKELLLEAYDRAPIGKTSVYWLVELALKEGNYEEAEEYFREYVEIAPEDTRRYILEYKLGRVTGKSKEELITLLEIVNEKEFSEEWSYELAYMYHEAGRVDTCIKLCDEIILYFGDGYFVEKALELKMLYQPLTKQQAEKYEDIKMKKDGYTYVRPEDVSGYAEILHNDVAIPTIQENPAKFNTINLQAELAKNMQQIMNATEQETVNSTMDNIRHLVEESHLPIAENTEEEEKEMYADIESEEEIDGSLSLNFQEILSEDDGGQMSFMVPETPMVERQITGQMSIEDVLAEWERTKKAAETAMEEARQRKLESAKAKAIAQTENLMDKIADVAKEYDNEPVQVMQEAVEAPETPNPMLAMSATEAFAAAGISLDTPEETESVEEPEAVGAEEEDFESDSVLEEAPSETAEEVAVEAAEEDFEPDEDEIEEDVLPEEDTPSEEIGEETAESEPEDCEESKDVTDEIPDLEAAIERNVMEDVAEAIEVRTDVEDEPIANLDKEQAEIFSYFMPVAGMEKQICSVIEGVRGRRKDETSVRGNVLIEGDKHSGKTVLATDLIKVIQQLYPHQTTKVGRIDAQSLNHKAVETVIEKIHGGYLIIEHAGQLNSDKAVELSMCMERDTGGLLVIMEDTKIGIREVMARSESLAKKFTEKIRIPIFTNDELVNFGKAYAIDMGYVIDELGVLALYNRIGNIRTGAHATTLTEVKEIVDEAIENAEKSGVSKAVRSLFSKRYDDDDNVILREKDFI